jgi:hypothetical protein
VQVRRIQTRTANGVPPKADLQILATLFRSLPVYHHIPSITTFPLLVASRLVRYGNF